jgi:cyclopropane fatty-acyl-phospholipid synthase-like methyltransferase
MLPDYQTERDRYLKHNNDVNDKGYQKFIAPLVDAVLARFNGSHKGLDYGSGQLSAVTHMLRHSGYSIEMYDPFFHNRPELLEKQYDYIVCCEVMEHFHYPKQEFLKLRSMLKKGGVLICMTELFTDDVDFGSWYYKNDFTHVFFYHPKSLDYIKNEFIFAKLERDNRLIQFVV